MTPESPSNTPAGKKIGALDIVIIDSTQHTGKSLQHSCREKGALDKTSVVYMYISLQGTCSTV